MTFIEMGNTGEITSLGDKNQDTDIKFVVPF